MPAAGPHFDKIEPPTPEDLKAFRHRHGLTAKAMASFIGVSYSVYRKWESGDVRAHPLASRVLCWIECGFTPPEFRAERVKAHA
jgi:DNA-binding transcriptional regulator YiaG